EGCDQRRSRNPADQPKRQQELEPGAVSVPRKVRVRREDHPRPAQAITEEKPSRPMQLLQAVGPQSKPSVQGVDLRMGLTAVQVIPDRSPEGRDDQEGGRCDQ